MSPQGDDRPPKRSGGSEGGGTPDKPVGTFYAAADLGGEIRVIRANSVGDRQEVRQRATQAALRLLHRLLVGERNATGAGA